MERRYSGSATSLAETIAQMEKEDMDDKDNKIETLVKIKKTEASKANRYSSEMAMHAARIKDLTSALKEISSTKIGV